jgi:hypothetical protein
MKWQVTGRWSSSRDGYAYRSMGPFYLTLCISAQRTLTNFCVTGHAVSELAALRHALNSMCCRNTDTVSRGWRASCYAHQLSEVLFAPERRFPFRVTRGTNTEVRLVAAAGDGACVWLPRFCRDQVHSRAQFPCQYNAADFDGPAPGHDRRSSGRCSPQYQCPNWPNFLLTNSILI